MSQISKDKLFALRHSAEHVLTQALISLYGKGKVIMAMGPATEDGFYFDFEPADDLKISEADFPKIEKAMAKIIEANLPIKKAEITLKEARSLFAGNPYKQEWLDEIEGRGEKPTVYWSGDQFVDLCAGPHVPSTGAVKAFKLLSVAGAYWHGDEKNKMLTRIYGTAFASKKKLDEYLYQLEEAKKRDHRLLGQKLELFMIDEEVGQGLILWLPKGAFVRHKAQEFAFNTYLERGYQPVVTPHIGSEALWRHSGHLDFYKENMYNSFGIEEEQYLLKPMNCPMHVRMYKFRPRSHKELPIRWTEMGTVYRYERSGVLHGLTRVRGFTQDDAHIICTPEQLHEELVEALKLTLYILETFGFKDFEMNLAVRDPENKAKYAGNDEGWEMAEQALRRALKVIGYENFVLDVGGAVFYGPKIDLKVADSIGRKWQLSTIQFDFNLPGRFAMKYIGEDGQEHEPFMIHRALLGSLERFMGVYIEHTTGAFPLWLSPVQVAVLPITDKVAAYGQGVAEQLKEAGVRVELDASDLTLSKKIRNWELQKVPYMLIVGEKEVQEKTVTVRKRGEKSQENLLIAKFLKRAKAEIEEKIIF